MIKRIRYWWCAWRWRRFIAYFDAGIAEARAKHRPTAHLLQAKQDFLHEALGSSRGLANRSAGLAHQGERRA